MSKLLTNSFNKLHNSIADSYMKVGYESMSAIPIQTSVKGDLPYLSYIFRKTYPLGIEFKIVACCVIGTLLLIEIQR